MESKNENPKRGESERLLSIAQKLLGQKDLSGAKEFAILAQENDPLLDGSDQIIAISDVLLSTEKNSEKTMDYYGVLGLEKGENDKDVIRRQYRRLALLLHPDKNSNFLADSAFKFVSQAWNLFSDTAKKAAYDRANGLAQTGPVYARVDLREAQQKLPVRRPVEEEAVDSFWTACPYCYSLYEYLRVYEDCCLRCPTCQRAFTGVTITTLPAFVPGREAYYCTQNLFPLPSAVTMGKPQSSPRVNHNGGVGATDFANGPVTKSYATPSSPGGVGGIGFMNGAGKSYPTPPSSGGTGFMNGAVPSSASGRKRGRPRKYPAP